MEQTDRITVLEERLAALETQQAELRTQLAKAQVEAWKGRVDDLDVQAHLAGMELRDRFKPTIEALQNRLLDARRDLASTGGQVGDAAASVADGVRVALDDLVEGLRDARAELTS